MAYDVGVWGWHLTLNAFSRSGSWGVFVSSRSSESSSLPSSSSLWPDELDSSGFSSVFGEQSGGSVRAGDTDAANVGIDAPAAMPLKPLVLAVWPPSSLMGFDEPIAMAL